MSKFNEHSLEMAIIELFCWITRLRAGRTLTSY